MLKQIHWILFLAVVVVLSACTRTFDPVPEHVKTIFPLEEGKYRTYKVIDTLYATGLGQENLHYYRHERNGQIETDLLDRETTTLYLYDSPDTLADTSGNTLYQWSFVGLWTQYADEHYAERTEGNVRYLILKMPPTQGSTWNGNLYNSHDIDTYEYINIDTTVTVQGKTYEHCVFVLQVPSLYSGDGTNYLLNEYAYEIYAPHIGKIVRYSKYIEKQNGSYEADSRVYFEEIVDHNYF